MKPAIAAAVVLFASLAPAQDSGDPPLKIAPPTLAHDTDLKVLPKTIVQAPGAGDDHAPPHHIAVPSLDPMPTLPEPTPFIEPPVPGAEMLRPPQRYRGPLYLDLQTINFANRALNSLHEQWATPTDYWQHEDMLRYRAGPDTAATLGGLVRGYYRNDQRIEWSGLESTFGAEGVLRPTFVARTDEWIVSTQGEFFLNKPYGSSILSDAERDLYRANFAVETFEVFQLFVECNYEDWWLRFGRSRTPFGRYQAPMYSNAMWDAPFIRTDVIGFTETGLFLRYHPGRYVFDLAVVNGEPNLDTNSSKALLTRWGIEETNWTAGLSMKIQDGISSEFQKRYNNVFGIDASAVLGDFLVYGEFVYDNHGFLRNPTTNDDYNPYNLGRRSLYGREAFKGDGDPIGGWGGYMGVLYRAENFLIDLSYGRYRPERIGVPGHDEPTNRLLFKTAYVPVHNLQVFLVGLAENRRVQDGLLGRMNPYAAMVGMQYGF